MSKISTMVKTISDAAARMGDDNISRIEIRFKVRTVDGMIYTMESNFFTREGLCELGYADSKSRADFVRNSIIHKLNEFTDYIEKNNFWMSPYEGVVVRTGDIVRVWVELGDMYASAKGDK